jgi:GT2 family glycosyltransferase
MVKRIRTNRNKVREDRSMPPNDYSRLTLEQRLARAKKQKSDIGRQKTRTDEIRKILGDKSENKRRIINAKKGGLTHNRPKKLTRAVKHASQPIAPKFPDCSENYLKEIKFFKVPDWFESKAKSVDVSIIVPLYKSQTEIAEQIYSWDLARDGLTKEIIYVDDASPDQSGQQVVDSWTARQFDLEEPVGRIITRTVNRGFGAACNTGAYHACGDCLIFLNADCTVTPGWIRPMISRLRSNPEIGIVGNLQVRHGKIDSAGSEWSWESKSFPHIGRNIYKNKSHQQFTLENAPVDLFLADEREMVTGCCFVIPKSLFIDLEGFDVAYRKGYWEDADLCLRARTNGHKIYYEPKSLIYHKLGHSNAGGHPYINKNREYFKDKWIDSGRIDPLVKAKRSCPPSPSIKKHANGKVYGCVIACNEEEFLEVSVDSVSSIVDEWIFVIGGNEYAYKAGMCNSVGLPNDSTVDIANDLALKYGGKVILPPGRFWKDKVEMRNAYATYLRPNNWLFVLDGDEVYKPDKLWRITELMKQYDVLIMQFWLFWNNINTIGTGKWSGYPQERVVRWKEGMAYRGTNHLHVSMSNGETAKKALPCWSGREKMFYHYSWVRPIDKIRQKLYYYKYQTGNNNDFYVENVFLKWRTNPDNVTSTHPMGGGGWDKFPGIHPDGIKKSMQEGKLDFASEKNKSL